MNFQFDPRKAVTNLRKHGVSFGEAASAFLDPNAASWPDQEHSSVGDERYIQLGYSTAFRLLVVVHNEADGVIRIISARLATPAEREIYEEA